MAKPNNNWESLTQGQKVTFQELLWEYSNWLLKKGYCDTDIVMEEPYAVDEFIKKLKE